MIHVGFLFSVLHRCKGGRHGWKTGYGCSHLVATLPVREVGDDALVAADAEEIDGQLCMTSVQLRGRLAVTDLF